MPARIDTTLTTRAWQIIRAEVGHPIRFKYGSVSHVISVAVKVICDLYVTKGMSGYTLGTMIQDNAFVTHRSLGI